jgi:hypothetical protein
MTISSINASGFDPSQAIGQVDGIVQKALDGIDGASGSSGGDQSSISGPAAMLSKLKALQESDPAKFKEVTADIAKQLRTAATQGGASAQVLGQVADAFDKASTTGDLSSLKPPSGGQGQPAGGGSYASSSSSYNANLEATLLKELGKDSSTTPR